MPRGETLAGGFPCNIVDVKKEIPQNQRFCGRNEAVDHNQPTAAGAIKLFGRPFSRKSRREYGVTSVLRSKTLAQAEFSSAEQVKCKRVPTKSKILWENFGPGRKGDLSGPVRKMKKRSRRAECESEKWKENEKGNYTSNIKSP